MLKGQLVMKTNRLKEIVYKFWCRLHRYRLIWISDHPFLKDANYIICWGHPGWHKIYKKFSKPPYIKGYTGLCHKIKRFISNKEIEEAIIKSDWYYGNPYDYPEKMVEKKY